MKTSAVLASLATALLLSACGDEATGPSSGGIEAALIGSWAKPGGTMFMDTLIFSNSGHYYVPYCSGDRGLKASGGQVWCPASQSTCGEYVLSGDTLFYEGLLGSNPDGVVPRTTSYTYLKVK